MRLDYGLMLARRHWTVRLSTGRDVQSAHGFPSGPFCAKIGPGAKVGGVRPQHRRQATGNKHDRLTGRRRGRRIEFGSDHNSRENRMTRKLLVALAAATGATLLSVPSASPFTTTPVWQCRGSSTYTSVSGQNR